MNSCGSCGVYIPEGQRFCSMCYGDPYYGHDGYYLDWLEDAARQEQEKKQWEEEVQEELEQEPQEDSPF